MKYDKIQVTGRTYITYPNSGGYSIQNWVIKCKDKKAKVKYKKLKNQQKQTVQQVIRGLHLYLRLVKVSYTYKQVLVVLVLIIIFVVLNGLILFKLVI